MQNPYRTLSTLLLVALLLPACGPQLTTKVAVSSANSVEKRISSEIVTLVNKQRNSIGKNTLQRKEVLDKMAREHVEFLRANRGSFGIHGPNISHFGVESRAFTAKHLHGMEQLSENVASAPQRGASSAAYLLELWLASPLHRQNLEGSWTNTGVGVVVDKDGTIFATQIFGSQELQRSHMAMLKGLRAH